MTRTLLICGLLMACGAEPGAPPAPADGGGDAPAADAAGDRPTGLTPRCIGTTRLDCDGNGDCETRRDDPMNCGVCGRICPAGQACVGGDCL